MGKSIRFLDLYIQTNPLFPSEASITRCQLLTTNY